MSFTEKSGKQVKFETPGDVLEGVITGRNPSGIIGGDGDAVYQYTMELPGDGGNVTFLGTVQLERLLADEVGSLVRIEYIAEVSTHTAGRRVKQFRVFVDDGVEPADKIVAKAVK